jgi:hypothetical protein
MLALLAVAGSSLVAGLVAFFGAAPVLAAILGISAVGLIVVQPGIATVLVVLVLYLNVPAILTQRHDVPEALAGAFILLLGFPLVAQSILRRQSFKGDRVFFLMLAFLGTLLLSSTAAVDRSIAIGRVQGFLLEGLVLFWLVINVVRDLPTLRRVMVVLLVAGTIVSGLCLYQDLTSSYDQEFGGLAYRNYDAVRDGQVTDARVARGHYDRAQGPVNEPNRFAQIMIVLIPLAVYLYRTGRSRLFRLAVAGMGVFVLIGITLTLSRGAMVALGLMAATMAAMGWIRASRLAIVIAGALILVPLVTPFYLDRISSIANVTYLTSNDTSSLKGADGAIRGRATEMLAAFNVFRDHPLIGVGPGQFAPFYVQDYSRNPDIEFRNIQGPRRAHTLYLELAAENGALGLGVFMAIVLVLLYRLWRARRELLLLAPDLSDLATACALSLLAYLGTGIFLHLSYQRYYWLLLAIATASLHIVTSVASRRGVGDGTY